MSTSARPVNPIMYREPEQQITLVQGTMPDSINEWNMAQALDKMEIDYRFQVPLGIQGLRGSQTIDFVVYNPRPTPTFVQGAYWHNIRTEAEDQLKQSEARQRYGIDPVLIEEHESDTLEHAIQVVRRKLM